MKSICNDWLFVKDPSEGFFSGEAADGAKIVRLPHTVAEVPLHYAAPEDYAGVYGYRRSIEISDTSKRYFIRFDGAAHAMELFINGRKAGEHFCGYTAFQTEITEYLHAGVNCVAVKLDCRERADVPPFGFVMDYLGYGGLYREAWLTERGPNVIEDVFVRADHTGKLEVDLTVSGAFVEARYTVLDGESVVDSFAGAAAKPSHAQRQIGGVTPWSPETPALYTLLAQIVGKDGSVLDSASVRFGFRTADFRADGLYLNGEKYFMRGLDRHQCWPYIGYAAPASLQREDARILKEELCCNAVRTSHYPQSRSFIDACDELGLLVFTEIPGWQHIGDEAWKQRSVENVREMVMQYRNHPSIVLWGVRINESADDDEFYRRTNALAHELDPTRATSGVRYIQKSSLLEDVYAYNDFSHNGKTPGCKRKKDVTPDMGKALLISEHNGHMFPTKSFDISERRQEHALRHARVLDAAYRSGEHAGCFGWCMFDYATHKDFGSGDRICYHGVMDSFRNPKLAAAAYRAQGEDEPFLEIGSCMDIGDYPAGNLGEIWAFTNADEVALFKNGNYVGSFRPEKSGLPHPPVHISDMVGEQLKTLEGYKGRTEELLHECLVASAKYGFDAMPLKYKLKMARLMAFRGIKYSEGVRLYGKYVGNWGGTVESWRFDAIKDGRVVASVTKQPSRKLRIDVKVSSQVLCEGATYDMASVRIRILDENGAVAPYAQLPIKLEAEGPIEIVGPSVVTAEGGMTGTFVKTTGAAGSAKLTVSAEGAEPAAIDLRIE